MSTEFSKPDDSQWDERPRGGASLLARGVGWIFFFDDTTTTEIYTLWQFWQGSANLMERLLVFGGLSAVALLFISVLLDRISSARTDPYREVEK